MDSIELKKAEEIYDDHREIYKAYCKYIVCILKSIIRKNGINYSNITGRVKEKKSFMKKCENDKYIKLTEITDIIGIRIITYTRNDLEKICSILENEFKIDKEKSVDKIAQMGIKEFGYLSIHCIFELDPVRWSLPENSDYKDMKFEIQIRTLAQHTWAEFSHHNNYKFSGTLPPQIDREFCKIAAALETIDDQFQSIADDMELYLIEMKKLIDKENTYASAQIDSKTLEIYLMKIMSISNIEVIIDRIDADIVSRVKKFGIENIEQLDDMISEEFKRDLIEHYKHKVKFNGILTIVMMVNDVQKYFDKSWKGNKYKIPEKVMTLLEKYNVNQKILTKYLSENF